MVRFGGTAVLGAVLLLNADFSGVAQLLSRATPAWLGLAVLLYAVDRLWAAAKWAILFRAHGRRLSLPRALLVYLQGSFLGAALPSTVGVDAVRAGMVREEAGSYSYALSSVVVERILGLAALGLCATVGILLFGSNSEWLALGRPVLIFGAVAGIAGVAFLLVPLRSIGVRRDGLVGRIVGFLEKLRQHIREYSRRPLVVCAAFGIAFLQHYLFIGINWVLTLSLGLAVPLSEMLWIWPIVMIAVRLPLSVLGFGVREVVIYQFFSKGGMSVEQSIGLGVLSGGLDLLFVMLGGLLVVLFRPSGWRQPAPERGRDGALSG